MCMGAPTPIASLLCIRGKGPAKSIRGVGWLKTELLARPVRGFEAYVVDCDLVAEMSGKSGLYACAKRQVVGLRVGWKTEGCVEKKKVQQLKKRRE